MLHARVDQRIQNNYPALNQTITPSINAISIPCRSRMFFNKERPACSILLLTRFVKNTRHTPRQSAKIPASSHLFQFTLKKQASPIRPGVPRQDMMRRTATQPSSTSHPDLKTSTLSGKFFPQNPCSPCAAHCFGPRNRGSIPCPDSAASSPTFPVIGGRRLFFIFISGEMQCGTRHPSAIRPSHGAQALAAGVHGGWRCSRRRRRSCCWRHAAAAKMARPPRPAVR